VVRIRDAFLEGRAQVEGAATAGMTVRDDVLAQIEQAFREPGDTGIQAKLTAVYNAWGDVANHPTEDGARTAVLQKTATLVAELHTTSANLDQQRGQTRSSLDVLALDVNAKTAAIADLNTAIKRGMQTGQSVNELADKRDGLVLELASAIGATSSPGSDGQVDVVVSGATLISGGSAIAIKPVDSRDPLTDEVTATRFVTDPGSTTVAVSGTAGGKLAALNETIPRYRKELDGVAVSLATEFNAAHTNGFDKAGVQGEPMFGNAAPPAAVDLSKVTAANLTLRITDTAKLAAASVAPVAGNASADNGAATAIGKLQNSGNGAAVAYRKLIVSLGVEASVATSNLQTQTVISSQVDASSESVSGVSIDEEMTNMLQFQHAYSAAARMITTIDETLDVLINRTGRVGL
jgi:flagellar hook-associated protein 1 FlgK